MFKTLAFGLPILFLLPLPIEASTRRFSYYDLVKKIDGDPKLDVPPATTIETLLERLPLSYRSNHTYVYKRPFAKRRDIHEASYLNPRAIVFGNDGKLILTFNGSRDQEGYFLIELARWLDNENKVELREIRFSPNGKDTAIVSSPNPSRCLRCHQENPRYIWEKYNMWPGVYGSFDDAIIEDTEEMRQFVSFRKTAESHPRYKYLIEALPTSNGFSPYYLEAKGTNPFSRPKKPSSDRRIENMPNLRLNEFLIRLNAKRIYASMKATSLFSRYKYLVVALLPMRCDTWGSWDEKKTNLQWKEIVDTIRADYEAKFPTAVLQKSFDSSFSIKARILELLNVPFDVDWTLSFNSDPESLPTLSSEYNDGVVPQSDYVSRLLWNDLALEEPKLLHYAYENKEYENELFRIGLLNSQHKDILVALGESLNLFPGNTEERIFSNKEACALVEPKAIESLRGIVEN